MQGKREATGFSCGFRVRWDMHVNGGAGTWWCHFSRRKVCIPRGFLAVCLEDGGLVMNVCNVCLRHGLHAGAVKIVGWEWDLRWGGVVWVRVVVCKDSDELG